MIILYAFALRLRSSGTGSTSFTPTYFNMSGSGSGCKHHILSRGRDARARFYLITPSASTFKDVNVEHSHSTTTRQHLLTRQ